MMMMMNTTVMSIGGGENFDTSCLTWTPASVRPGMWKRSGAWAATWSGFCICSIFGKISTKNIFKMVITFMIEHSHVEVGVFAPLAVRDW